MLQKKKMSKLVELSYTYYKDSAMLERAQRLNRKPHDHREREFQKAKRTVLEVKAEITREALKDEEIHLISKAAVELERRPVQQRKEKKQKPSAASVV